MRSLRILFVVTTVSFAVPREGMGAGNWQARERAAKRACLNGDADKGVAILTELFIDTDDINYLFNQGRCFEQNRRYEEAIGRFREYLGKGDKLTKKEKAEAEARIARCESYLPKSEPPKPAVVEAPKPPVEKAPEPAVAIAQAPPPPSADPPAPVAVVARSEPRTAAERPSAGTRVAGIVVGAVGVAGIATGVVLNLKVNQMSSDLGKPDNYSRSTDSSRKTYKTLGWISYGVGAACLATGSLLYYLGWRSASGSATVAWAPTVSPEMAGLALQGAF